MRHTLTFIVAGDPAQLTGGYIYDARIVAGLRARGWTVEVVGLDGQFPLPDARARAALSAALAALPEGTLVVIDGLAMGGMPEVVAAHGGRLHMVALVHHPLADETGLDEAGREAFLRSEAAALARVGRVVATSRYTARRLAALGLAAAADVVAPGVEPAPLARAEGAVPHLLCVASVIPRKGHEVLVAALATLRELDWTCECIGSLGRDPAHAARLMDRVEALGLGARLRWCGEQAADALRQAYVGADVFVLPSYYEGYGMVIDEALAHGLPVLTTTGGALAETLPPGAGLQVPPGDAMALAAALRRLIGEPELRRDLREGARRARLAQRGWKDAAAEFDRVLGAA